MIKIYRNDDDGYLAWVLANPNGYVVNTDDPPTSTVYPMVHTARHKVVSSPCRTNYTTDRYVKYCSLDLDELNQYVQDHHKRDLQHCKTCMRKRHDK